MRLPSTLCRGLFFVVAVANASAGRVSRVSDPGAGGEPELRDVASPGVPLVTILDGAGAYVKRYSDTFRNVLAEETCRQWLGGQDWVPSREDNLGIYGPQNAHQRIEMRSLRSELVWVTVPGPQPWGIFRDVVELNGRKLKNHEGRLERLFASPVPTALAAPAAT